jgi:cbb3-type cytochrome oxidase maturation protein
VEVIYGLLPAMLLIGVLLVGVLFWALRNGQYDDPDGAASRILMDDDDPLLPENQTTTDKDGKSTD